MPVRALVFARWRREAACEVRRLEPQEALAALIEDRLWLGDPITRGAAQRFLAWLVVTPAFRVDYAALEDACAAIVRVV